MDTGERSYTAGKSYEFFGTGDYRHGRDDSGHGHVMNDHYIRHHFVKEEEVDADE